MQPSLFHIAKLIVIGKPYKNILYFCTISQMEKLRVLFYYENFCGEHSRGGTEVATARIARALRLSGRCEVFCAYRRGNATEPNPYDATIRLHGSGRKFADELAGFIRSRRIDAVVNMGRFFRQVRLKQAIEKSGRNVSLIFMHHFAPGSENRKVTWSAAWRLIRLDPLRLRYWLRLAFYPLVRLPRRLGLAKIYRKVYSMSDATVLLSPNYIDEYAALAGIEDKSRFAAIPNIFESEAQEESPRKEKRVLILSRMDELQKRISLALRVWAEVEKDDELTDWHLDIVGSGSDMRGLRRLADALGLQRATFHGWQDSRPYMRRSAIFMMTSAYEGLPLSMIEALNYGAVPIAFNSFSSLSDIITGGGAGVAVDEEGGVEAFAEALRKLMRRPLPEISAARPDAFTPEAVATRWLDLLSSLRN